MKCELSEVLLYHARALNVMFVGIVSSNSYCGWQLTTVLGIVNCAMICILNI